MLGLPTLEPPINIRVEDAFMYVIEQYSLIRPYGNWNYVYLKRPYDNLSAFKESLSMLSLSSVNSLILSWLLRRTRTSLVCELS